MAAIRTAVGVAARAKSGNWRSCLTVPHEPSTKTRLVAHGLVSVRFHPQMVKRVVADDKLEHDASHAPRVYEVAVVRVVHHNLAGRFGAHGEGAGDTRVSESSDLRW